jgi:hypothetical protein
MSEKFKKEIEKYPETVKQLLEHAWIVASSGYLTTHSTGLDNSTIFNLISESGLVIDSSKKCLEWGSSTFGIGKQLRDCTYKCIKDSIYPLMKVLAENGKYEFQFSGNKWLCNAEGPLLCGYDYFTNDGFECILKDNIISGFSWKYATFGYALTLHRLSEMGFLNVYLPFLKSNFEENPNEGVDVSPQLLREKFTPFMLNYLKEKENIYLDNCRFYKKSQIKSSTPPESDPLQTSDSKQLHAMETDKS